MNSTDQNTSDFIRDFGAAAVKNPVSAALIGIGALWLFTNRSGAAQWTSGQALKNNMQETANAARELSSSMIDKLTTRGETLADTAKEHLATIPDSAANALAASRTSLEELFDAQPLALGAVGLVIGATVAASFSTSKVENAYLGEASDYVKQTAEEITSKHTDNAMKIGKKVFDAAVDEAQQQGITTADLAIKAKDVLNKASRVGAATRKDPVSD